MKELLAQILLSAAGEIWKRDPTLGKYTAKTAEHELNRVPRVPGRTKATARFDKTRWRKRHRLRA